MRNLKSILRKLKPNIEISFGSLVINMLSFVGVVFFSINIFNVIKLGIERYNLINEEKLALANLQMEKTKRQSDLEWYSSLTFIESQSRDYLNLSNEGDSVIVVPESTIEAVTEKDEIIDKVFIEPDIQNWINLIF
jgi:hypothetical protein